MKDAIQAHSGDISAAEAECARIVAEMDEDSEELQKEAQQVSGKNSDDAVVATLQRRLHETGHQVLQL